MLIEKKFASNSGNSSTIYNRVNVLGVVVVVIVSISK